MFGCTFGVKSRSDLTFLRSWPQPPDERISDQRQNCKSNVERVPKSRTRSAPFAGFIWAVTRSLASDRRPFPSGNCGSGTWFKPGSRYRSVGSAVARSGGSLHPTSMTDSDDEFSAHIIFSRTCFCVAKWFSMNIILKLYVELSTKGEYKTIFLNVANQCLAKDLLYLASCEALSR